MSNIISRLRVSLGLDNSKFKAGLKQSEKQTKTFGKFMKTAGASIAGFFAFTQIVSGIKSVIKTNKDFEKSLSTLQSLTGVTNKELEFYSKEAKRMGETTTQTASQVANAFTLIGSKKPELLASKEALAAVTAQAIILAEAANIDVVQAATALTGSLNQMGKGANSANEFINVLAAGSKFGAADISFLNAAISKAGGTANAVKLEFAGLVAGIETIAPKIAEPTTAGLQFRQVLVKLAKESGKYGEGAEGLSKQLHALQGEQLSVNELTNKFGILNINAAKALIDGADAFDGYLAKVKGTNTAMEQQAINVDNLDGDTRQFTSALEGLILKLQTAQGAFRGITQAGTSFLRMLSGADVGVAGAEKAVSIFEGIEKSIKGSGKDAERALSIELENLENEFKTKVASLKNASERETILESLLFGAGDILTGGNLSAKRTKKLQIELETNLQLREKLNTRIRALAKERLDEEEARILGTSDLNEEVAAKEIDTIESVGKEIKALKTIQATASGENLANTNKEIESLKNYLALLKQVGTTASEIKPLKLQTPDDLEALEPAKIRGQELLKVDASFFDNSEIDERRAAQVEKQKMFVDEMNSITQGGMASLAEFTGEFIGAVITGDAGLEDFFSGILAQVGDFVKQFGQALIAYGIAQIAFKKAFANPAAAIAAGVALVAIGSVISSLSAAGPGGSSSGGSVTSIDTRSPDTRNASVNNTGQAININVQGVLKGTDIALSAKQGQKQLDR